MNKKFQLISFRVHVIVWEIRISGKSGLSWSRLWFYSVTVNTNVSFKASADVKGNVEFNANTVVHVNIHAGVDVSFKC